MKFVVAGAFVAIAVLTALTYVFVQTEQRMTVALIALLVGVMAYGLALRSRGKN
ncbi:MAG: hypothetical protein AAF619_11895 [Pseudomonadota bacterium]